jgi:hypothetical protein
MALNEVPMEVNLPELVSHLVQRVESTSVLVGTEGLEVVGLCVINVSSSCLTDGGCGLSRAE